MTDSWQDLELLGGSDVVASFSGQNTVSIKEDRSRRVQSPRSRPEFGRQVNSCFQANPGLIRGRESFAR